MIPADVYIIVTTCYNTMTINIRYQLQLHGIS
jgi:hypothetical protein